MNMFWQNKLCQIGVHYKCYQDMYKSSNRVFFFEQLTFLKGPLSVSRLLINDKENVLSNADASRKTTFPKLKIFGTT